MKQELITIIVPIYNVENFLKKCLDSIIMQTYNKLEIILIDDGSNDKSGFICDEYAKKDKRIRVIHQANKGLSEARNRGIELSNGKYIGFVDSDDYISKDMYKTLYYNIKSYNADISICKYKYIKKDCICTFDNIDNIEIYGNYNAIKILLDNNNKIITDHMWNKLYKKELFNNIKFPCNKNYEDVAIQYKLINLSNKIVYTPSCLYAYCERRQSILNNTNEILIHNKIDFNEMRAKFLLNKYPLLKNEIQKNLFICYLTSFCDISKTNNRDIIYNDYFSNKYKKMVCLKKKINFKELNLKLKLIYYLLIINKKLFLFFYHNIFLFKKK